MGILIQAMRAVFIEMLGVILVLWLLFGSVTWTLESTGVRYNDGSASDLMATLTSSVRTHLTGRPEARQVKNAEVSERLDHYSRAYGRAATGYLKQITENLTNDLSQRDRM